jgi:hypothetical protein
MWKMIEINLQKLDRGTKTEWRTVTRGGKTFKQRFRVGKKDTTSDVISNFEAKIHGQDYETAGVFSDTGEMIFEKSGEKDHVNFTKEEGESFKGATLTHNHPKGDSFSPQDLQFACQCEMKAVRVTCRSCNKTFVLRSADGADLRMELWKDSEMTGTVGLGFMLHTYGDEVWHENRAKIKSGDMTIAEAEGSHWQEVWKRVNEHDNRIIYEEV